jgi:protein-tyrosine phosphatase
MTQARGVERQFVVDSCGTGSWHVGGNADPRTIAVAKKYNVPIAHKARRLAPLYDFTKFDLILAMDQNNVDDILLVGGDSHVQKIRRLREFDPALRGSVDTALDVPDPYYGGADGFDRMYHMIHAACAGLLDEMLRT